ncbi:hypothetical protein DMI70_21730 [Escherichia coli]|nr:hypothetical protein [Escherichia coli]
MASAYNTPVVAIYADYKTRWPAMADVSEQSSLGKIDNISLDEFAKALKVFWREFEAVLMHENNTDLL